MGPETKQNKAKPKNGPGMRSLEKEDIERLAGTGSVGMDYTLQFWGLSNN